MVEINEIKKDLYKSKAVAKLMYYEPANGDLMYTINALGRDWVFPIHTVQNTTLVREYIEPNPNGGDVIEYEKVKVELKTITLTPDLKGARFEPEIKGSSLVRWIQQAIDKDEFH